MRGDGRVFLKYMTETNPGVWHISFYFNGKELRESSHSSDRKVAEKLLKQRKKEVGADDIGARKFIPPSKNKVVMKELLDSLERDLKIREVWESSRLYSPLKVVREVFGDYKIVNVTSRLIEGFVLKWQDDKKANSTINKRLLVLKMAFKLGNKKGNISASPTIPHLSDHNPRQGFFEREEFDKVLPHLPDDLKDFCLFGFLTAWRKGEIASLLWEDVDMVGKFIHLKGVNSKNGHPRKVALQGELWNLIERCLKVNEIITKDSVRTSQFVFHRENGRQVKDFRKIWSTACQKAGLKAGVKKDGVKIEGGKIFHDFRRTGIRNMTRNGVPEGVAMKISGHKTRGVFDRYNITSEKDLQEAAEKISLSYRKGREENENTE